MAGGCLCNCNTVPTLIFSCSGSGDVGEMTDLAARKLDRDGFGKMTCLAGIGGRINGIMMSTKTAVQLVVIDGCRLNCAKQCLEQASFTDFIHVQLADLGFEKGASDVTTKSVTMIFDECIAKLREIYGDMI